MKHQIFIPRILLPPIGYPHTLLPIIAGLHIPNWLNGLYFVLQYYIYCVLVIVYYFFSVCLGNPVDGLISDISTRPLIDIYQHHPSVKIFVPF